MRIHVMLWAMCAALGCGANTPVTKPAPATKAPTASTKPVVTKDARVPTPVATPAIAQPTVQVAQPIANAIVASNAKLPVIIPAPTDADSKDDSADPLVELRAIIAAQMLTARQRKATPAATVVVYFDTTDDYGCACPPFVLAPFYNAGDGGFIWPKFAPGVSAAPSLKGGLLRVAGHFEGSPITGYQAANRRAPKLNGAAKKRDEEAEPDPLLERHPAFFVDAWCFEPSATISPSTLEIYGPQLTALAEQGRFCVGTKFPIVTP